MSSYTQSYYHIVFRTKYSEPTIPEAVERQLYMYIHTMSKNKGCKILRIGGMADHIHIFVSLPSTMALANYVKQIKEATSKWLKENPLFPNFRGWATGYAGLSYSEREKDIVVNYIKRQKEHHRVKSFREEYQGMLEDAGIKIDFRYFLNED